MPAASGQGTTASQPPAAGAIQTFMALPVLHPLVPAKARIHAEAGGCRMRVDSAWVPAFAETSGRECGCSGPAFGRMGGRGQPVFGGPAS
jgi:hypothetical protein